MPCIRPSSPRKKSRCATLASRRSRPFSVDGPRETRPVLHGVPPERLLVVRTEDLSGAADAMARFAGVPEGTVRPAHANRQGQPQRSARRGSTRVHRRACAGALCRPDGEILEPRLVRSSGTASGVAVRACVSPRLGAVTPIRLDSTGSTCARSSTDRASDYGSEGWGFESLRARSSAPRLSELNGATPSRAQ